MGSITTAGYADAVVQGIGTLDQAVAAHLRYNFFPPSLLSDMVNPLIFAIQMIEEGDPDCWVIVDGSVIPRAAEQDTDGTWYVSARDLVDACKAWEFVRTDDEQE